MIEKALHKPLTKDEALLLSSALKKQEPWLEWTGKHEKKYFVVDPVALNIHERISTQALLKIAKRENAQRDLFADPELDYREAVKFYQHEMDWSNRLILGDSLQVMASLAYRENLAGQVQMIYFDPPYGIKFSSNFQSEVGSKNIRDTDSDLTREPEMIKAYRDTWSLGIHSYLSYLKDRFILAKKLLSDSGSLFVQISKDNIDYLKTILSEIFGPENNVGLITLKKTAYQASNTLANVADYLLWFAKDIHKIKINPVFLSKLDIESIGLYKFFEKESGEITQDEVEEIDSISNKRFRLISSISQGETESGSFPYEFQGVVFSPPQNNHWKTTKEGLNRVAKSNRLVVSGKSIAWKGFIEDFPVSPINNIWTDTMTGSFTDPKIYVVQTNTKIISRCILMCTDPGDLILDPTCGSGTSAYVAEQWGRRWITIDTSRVALALTRQRLLTAKYEHFKLENIESSPSKNNPFIYLKVPHITLKSIAQNIALDPIFEKYESLLDNSLKNINDSIKKVSDKVRTSLLQKLYDKQKNEGKKAITDADERRWKLPQTFFENWEVPFDTDELYPADLKKSIEEYRKIWRQKMIEVNSCIQANAEQIDLYDRPEIIKGVVRVSGPFTVEGVMPAEYNKPIFNEKEEENSIITSADKATNAVSFLDNIMNLLKREGVNFLGNKHMKFNELRVYESGNSFINFEGEWVNGDNKNRKVAVSIGPQHGPITAYQVENTIRIGHRHGFDDIIFCGFNFTSEAQGVIQDDNNPEVRLHLAQINPDVQMKDLLKTTGTGQIFTVFGSPRTKLIKQKDGQYQVEMEGVDIYDPVNNVLIPTKADKVAAWFIDSDYDSCTFCITQAFFPNRDAWDKLEKALKGIIDKEKFDVFAGTLSLPFPIGTHKKVAVKVIDPRGNEVMKVHNLNK